MELSDRLSKLLEYSAMNKSEFSRFVGFKTPQALRELLKGNTKTLSDTAQKKLLKAFPNLNSNWLLKGEGDMFIDAEEEEVPSSPKRLIPFYDVETTGGYNGTVSSSDAGSLIGYIQSGDWFDGRETAAIRHVGDSMIEYPNECVLAVREVTDRHLLVPGRNYVIETTEYRVTKRVQLGSQPDRIALYSTNQERYADGRLIYEPFEVAFSDIRRIFSVLGYVVNQSGEFRIINPKNL